MNANLPSSLVAGLLGLHLLCAPGQLWANEWVVHTPATPRAVQSRGKRLSRIKATLTEFYFALNFTHTDFMRIVQEVLSHQGPAPTDRIFLSINYRK